MDGDIVVPPYAELHFWQDHFYLLGDREALPVYPRPVGKPQIVTGLPQDTTRDELHERAKDVHIKHANALAWSACPLRENGNQFDAVIQWYVISDNDVDRARHHVQQHDYRFHRD